MTNIELSCLRGPGAQNSEKRKRHIFQVLCSDLYLVENKLHAAGTPKRVFSMGWVGSGSQGKLCRKIGTVTLALMIGKTSDTWKRGWCCA